MRTRGARRAALLLVATITAGCGARSSLLDGGGGDAASGGGATNATSTSSAHAASSGSGPSCDPGDLATWRTERFRDDGDYERFAVAASGVPWVALKVKGGNIVLEELGVDAAAGIVVLQRIEVPDTPVYPVALDVDDDRFVMLTTTGINWNGDVALHRIDRHDGQVASVPIGNPPADPAFTVGSALGLAGKDIVVAYGRAADDQATIELRSDDLALVASEPVTSSSFAGVHRSDTAFDVYVGAAERVRVEGGTFEASAVDPDWEVIGGLGDWDVQIGQQIRLFDGTDDWPADWPHTQISPPAVVRTNGSDVAFSLETELTGVVGHIDGGALRWLAIEPTLDAPGTGVVMMPVVESGRLGVFYLGLEIPMPEQPLRYYGLECH